MIAAEYTCQPYAEWPNVFRCRSDRAEFNTDGMERNFIKDNLMGIMYAHRNKSHWWMLLVTKINAFHFIGTAWKSFDFIDLGPITAMSFVLRNIQVVTRLNVLACVCVYPWLPHSSWPELIGHKLCSTISFICTQFFGYLFVSRWFPFVHIIISATCVWCWALNLTICSPFILITLIWHNE